MTLVSKTTALPEGSMFPQTTIIYRCPNVSCQKEKDKETAKRIKLQKEKDLASGKRLTAKKAPKVVQ